MRVTKDLTEKNESLRAEIYDWLDSIVSAVIICLLIFVFLGKIVDVDGSSMMPTLNDKDKVLMSGLFYRPKQGDIIILSKESYSEIPLVKRVIALEGQTVDFNFNTGDVSVDGLILDEPYINEITHSQYDVTFPVTVPEGFIFVMGDNRNRSTDSRDSRVGFIDKRCVLGKVYVRIWPFKDFEIVSHG